MAKKKNRTGEYAARRQERLADKLAAVEDYTQNVPAALRRLLENKASPQDILDFAASLAAARMVTELGGTDAARAITVAKDILDRTQGKAKESVTTTHKFDKLDDAQIDALIHSKLREASIAGGTDDGESEAT